MRWRTGVSDSPAALKGEEEKGKIQPRKALEGWLLPSSLTLKSRVM